MAESYSTQLDRVQTAIAAVESGAQAYDVAGRSLTRADLSTLYKRETYLRGRVAREARPRSGARVRLMQYRS